MSTRIRIGLTTAALAATALAGTPAHAACTGCGGAAVKGSASISGHATGAYSKAHTLSADCVYESVPVVQPDGSKVYSGSFSVSGVTDGPFRGDLSTKVDVSCRLTTTSGAVYQLSKQNSATGSTTAAQDSMSVPALMQVDKICVSADGYWDNGLAGGDSASLPWATCAGSGVGIAIAENKLEASLYDVDAIVSATVCPVLLAADSRLGTPTADVWGTECAAYAPLV
jgi:hypothetical protein